MSTRFILGRCLDESVIIDSTTGYINATQLCMNENKKLTDWQKTPLSKEQIKHFITNMKCLTHDGNPSYEVTHEEVSHIQLIKNIKSSVVGIYYHKYLINLILQWLSPVYALKSSIIVDEFIKIRNEGKAKPTKTNDSHDRLKDVHSIVTNIQELVSTIIIKLDKTENIGDGYNSDNISSGSLVLIN